MLSWERATYILLVRGTPPHNDTHIEKEEKDSIVADKRKGNSIGQKKHSHIS